MRTAMGTGIAHAARRSILTDPDTTSNRYGDLATYCQKCLLRRGQFICPSASACHASTSGKPGVNFYEGVMSYVGTHYDTTVVSRDASHRVLIVPMEDGGHRDHVTLAQRRMHILESAALPFRERNPHMRGVTLALRLAFGHRLAEDRPGEHLDSQHGPVHLFNAFAMANLTLCSALATGTRSSRTTPVMREECLQHMRATITILEPTLIISQGARLSRPLQSLFTIEKQHNTRVATCRLEGVQFVWVDLHHPTFNWDWINRPYLHDVVAPAIRDGRRRAIKFAAG
jgi:hypothetical protein